MSAVTDSERETRFEYASPGVKNLLSLYQVLTDESQEEVEARFEGQGYGTLKKAVLGGGDGDIRTHPRALPRDHGGH